MSATDRHHEMLGDRRTSPLDDVHAAPYAAYAERILAGKVMGDDHEANPLSSVMNTANQEQTPELEPGSQEYEEQQMDKFFDDVEAIRKQIGPYGCHMSIGDIGNNCSRNDFEVAPDPDTGKYCIQLKNNPESNDILIYLHQFNSATVPPLNIPSSLRGVDEIVSHDIPLANVPDKVGRYKVSGVRITSVLYPQTVENIIIEDTNIVNLPEFPSSTKSLVLTGNTKLMHLPALPGQLNDLKIRSNNGDLCYEIDQFPSSLRYLTTSINRYTLKQRRAIRARGIQLGSA